MANVNREPARTWASVFYPPPDYTYFQRPFVPPMPSTSRGAALAADAAMLAYGRHGEVRFSRMELGDILARAGFAAFALIGDWSVGPKGTQALFAYNERLAILAFRGTEKEDWKDIAVDLAGVLVDEEEIPTSFAETVKTLFQIPSARLLIDNSRCGVHSGFQYAFNRVWPETSEWLEGYRQRFPQAEICFTGHSLGAALATLAASRFTGGNASLFTFGCPRTGNTALVNRVRARADLGCFRYVDGQDIVTAVPPQMQWYRHDDAALCPLGPPGSHPVDAMEAMRALAGLGTAVLSDPPPDWLADHSPGLYCYRLWNSAV